MSRTSSKHARTHTRARVVLNSSRWRPFLEPFLILRAKLSYRSTDLSATTLENKYLSPLPLPPPSPLSSPPRFNPWPQNQFAAGGSRDFRQQPQQPGLSSPSSTREERICGKRGYKNVREYPQVVRFAAQNRNGTSESLLFYSPLGE